MLRFKKVSVLITCLAMTLGVARLAAADVFALKSELAGKHPRIIFTESEAAALAAKAATDMFIRLDYTLTWKNAGTYTYNASYADAGQQSWWYGAGAAIYAALSRNATDITRAKKWWTDLTYNANWGYNAETTIGLNTAHYVAAYALIYDCLYNDLSEAERDVSKAKLVQAIQMFHSKGYESGATGAAAYWLNDYQNNHMHFRLTGSLFSLIAIWGEVSDDLTMYADNIIKYFRRLDYAIAPDGSNHEGFNYSHYGHALLTPAVYAYHRCIDTGTSYDMVSPAYTNSGYFGVYMMTPDWKSCFGFGDSGNGPSDNLNYLFHSATELGNPYLQKGMVNVETAIRSNFSKTPQWSVVFKDSGVPQGDLNDIPKHHYFYDQGIVTCRASWDDADATAFAFKCGPMGGKRLNDTRGTEYSINTDYINVAHDDPDQGSFLLFTKGSFLSTGDGYEKTDKITSHHSTMQVDGATQYGGGGWSQPTTLNKWGWQRDFASGGELVTFTGDMKGCYPSMDKLDRTFASMKANYAVIYDAMESATSGRAYDWRMNSSSAATHTDKGSGMYQVTNGNGSVLVKKLAPSTGTWAVESWSGDGGSFKALHCNITGQQDQKFLVMVAPNATDLSMVTAEYTSGTTMGVKVSLSGKTEYVLFADANAISAGDVTATAKTVLTSADGSDLEYAAASNASALTYNGTQIMSSDTPVNFGADYSAGAANGGQFRVRASTGSDTASGASVTIGNLAASTSYPVTINGVSQGNSSSNGSGQLTVAVDLDEDQLIVIGSVTGISQTVSTAGAPGITLAMDPVVTTGKISLHTSVGQTIRVRLLAADGRCLGTLAEGYHAAGRYTLETGTGHTAGVHFLEVNGSLYKVILAD